MDLGSATGEVVVDYRNGYYFGLQLRQEVELETSKMSGEEIREKSKKWIKQESQ